MQSNEKFSAVHLITPAKQRNAAYAWWTSTLSYVNKALLLEQNVPFSHKNYARQNHNWDGLDFQTNVNDIEQTNVNVSTGGNMAKEDEEIEHQS